MSPLVFECGVGINNVFPKLPLPLGWEDFLLRMLPLVAAKLEPRDAAERSVSVVRLPLPPFMFEPEGL